MIAGSTLGCRFMTMKLARSRRPSSNVEIWSNYNHLQGKGREGPGARTNQPFTPSRYSFAMTCWSRLAQAAGHGMTPNVHSSCDLDSADNRQSCDACVRINSEGKKGRR